MQPENVVPTTELVSAVRDVRTLNVAPSFVEDAARGRARFVGWLDARDASVRVVHILKAQDFFKCIVEPGSKTKTLRFGCKIDRSLD